MLAVFLQDSVLCLTGGWGWGWPLEETVCQGEKAREGKKVGGRESTQKAATRTVTFKITDKLEKQASSCPAPGVIVQAHDPSTQLGEAAPDQPRYSESQTSLGYVGSYPNKTTSYPTVSTL